MKKIFGLILGLTTLMGCSDPDTHVDVDKWGSGGFAKFATAPVLTADLGSGKYVAHLADANSNIVDYRIIQVSANIGGQAYPAEVADIKLNFPGQITIEFEKLTALFGLTPQDLTYGDSFKLIAQVTTADGKKYSGIAASTNTVDPLNLGGTLSADLNNTGLAYNSAMAFSFTLACPSFNVNEMLGTYEAINDDFQLVPASHTFVCVKGANDNQIVFKNYTDEGKDLIVTINPAAQSAVVVKQESWKHPTFGWASVETVNPGLVFSCIGQVNLALRHTVSAGSFGTFPITLKKVQL